MPRKGVSILDPVKNELIAYYLAGNSIAATARHFASNAGTVKDFLHANRVKVRTPGDGLRLVNKIAAEGGQPIQRRGSKLDSVKDEVIALYQSGKTLHEVGERFGASYIGVRHFLRVNGVSMRSKSESTKNSWTSGKLKERAMSPEVGPYVAVEQRAKQGPTTQPDLIFMTTEDCRRCPKCERMVPRSEWWKFEGKGRSAYCKACHRDYTKVRTRNRERDREYARNRRAAIGSQLEAERKQLRAEVLEAYGSACACCGESESAFLAIDHRFGGGMRHRLHLRLSGVSSFYAWLRKNGFPPEFQLLCHNCNSSHGYYGYCPHKDSQPFVPDYQDLAGRAKANAKRKAGMRLIRVAMIEGYGGKCNCCGETRPEFLSLDHRNGDGAKHRAEMKAEGRGWTYHLYRQVIEDGFPNRFQILCHNCNFSRGKYGSCPHRATAESHATDTLQSVPAVGSK